MGDNDGTSPPQWPFGTGGNLEFPDLSDAFFSDVGVIAPPTVPENQTVDDGIVAASTDENIDAASFFEDVFSFNEPLRGAPKEHEPTQEAQGLVLYNYQNIFRRVPSKPPKAARHAIPDDGLPWTDDELHMLRNFINSGWSPEIYYRVNEVSQLGIHSRSVNTIKNKFDEMVIQATRLNPWELFAEKEMNIVKSAKGGNLEIRQLLVQYGFERKVESVKKFRKTLSENGNDISKFLSLEQSYEIRELSAFNIPKLEIARVCGISSTLLDEHLAELSYDIKPVPWSPEEDDILVQGVNQFGAQWRRVKAPLYGRSTHSCMRRYELLCQPIWSAQENSNMLAFSTSVAPQNLENLDYNRLAQGYNRKTALQCELRLKFILFGSSLQKFETHEPNRRALYSAMNQFFKFPSGPGDLRLHPTPEDGLPWTSGELTELYKHSQPQKPFSEEIVRLVSASSGRSETDQARRSPVCLQRKMDEFKKSSKYFQPWYILCEKEIEILVQNAEKGYRIAKAQLVQHGFQITYWPYKTFLKNLRQKAVGQPVHPDITLEESYEIRELVALYGKDIPRIHNIMQVRRKDRDYPLITLQAHLNSMLGYNNCMQPVMWTVEEDDFLVQSVNTYGDNWDLVKEPLFGRSVRSCIRRYETICRKMWEPSQTQQLVEMCKMYSPGEPDYSEVAKSFPSKTALQCKLRYICTTNDSHHADPDFVKIRQGSPNKILWKQPKASDNFLGDPIPPQMNQEEQA